MYLTKTPVDESAGPVFVGTCSTDVSMVNNHRPNSANGGQLWSISETQRDSNILRLNWNRWNPCPRDGTSPNSLAIDKSTPRSTILTRAASNAMPHPTHIQPQSPEQATLPVHERYWNKNLPQSQHTENCPDALLGISLKNIQILSGRQEFYQRLGWKECQVLVAENRIGDFQRSPLALRQYLLYMHKLKQQYGSVLSFVQHERLRWDSNTPSGDEPFSNPTDFTILYNDWPYGIDSEVTHLVVWTKFLLEDDQDGFLTPQTRQRIDAFVAATFAQVPRDRLIWFKNWSSLKSIHALEHFHIMVYQADQDWLKQITNGDVPMSDKVT